MAVVFEQDVPMRNVKLSPGVMVMVLVLSACDGGADGSGGSAGEAGAAGSTASAQGSAGGEGGTPAGGSAGEAGSAGGSTGGGGAGGSMDDLAPLSDDFEDASTLSAWTFLHEELGLPAPHTLLDIDTTVPGRLVIEPTVSAWYQSGMATFLYKEVTGDFLVEVSAAAFQKGTGGAPPAEQYNSAGLLVRDPGSTLASQSWLMYNIGYQDQFIGVEGKATVASQSELILLPTGGVHEARLRLCRVGDTVRMLRRLPGEPTWTETHTFPGTFPQTAPFALPATVQVGLIDNAYLVAGLRAEFEYIEFSRPRAPADCAAD
jgi:regulation of enolase protein 1 (concanavalin A-like superfamily)